MEGLPALEGKDAKVGGILTTSRGTDTVPTVRLTYRGEIGTGGSGTDGFSCAVRPEGFYLWTIIYCYKNHK